jgi:8-oxo-dGTP pyrophosphatase MutT (NUDIX family)
VSVTTLDSSYVHKHPYFTARKDSYRTEKGKIVDPYFVVELPTGVVAMAITEEENIILIKQYRHPIKETLIELPGGFIDADEQPQQAIIRELQEETGYTFPAVQYLGITAANPGLLNNHTHMFLATGGVKTSEQQLDQNEEIEIIFKSVTEVKMMLQHNEFRQSLHGLCLFLGFDRLQSNK